MLWLLACTDLAWVPATLSPDTTPLTFAPTALGQTATLPFLLENPGTEPIEVQLQADPPFGAVPAVTVAPGENTVSLSFTPSGYGEASGILFLFSPDQSWQILLSGSTLADADGDGANAVAAGGDDCEDEDPAIFPTSPEVCGDGLDQDCDGVDASDCDTDGSLPPLDCDDQNATVFPGAPDVSDDLDNDCDGRIDEDALQTGALLISEISLDPAWIELCASTRLHLDGIDLRGNQGLWTLPSLTMNSGDCLAFCATTQSGCNHTLDLRLDRADALLLLADTVLDSLSWDNSWPEPNGAVWSLDPQFLNPTENDEARNWCLTAGSPGEMNPTCP